MNTPGTLALTLLAMACSPVSPVPSTNAAGAYHPERTPETHAPAAVTLAPQPVLPQYRRFHQVVENALATDDPTAIRSVATGVVADALERNVRDQLSQGIVRRGHTALNPQAFLLPGLPSLPGLPDGDRALITDCLVSTGLWTYRRDTGARTGPPPRPLRERFRALLTKEDGVWKVFATSVPASSAC